MQLAFTNYTNYDVRQDLFPQISPNLYNQYREFESSVGCQKKIVYLVDKTHLFKISNLVYDGREIVRSLYSSLQGQVVYGGLQVRRLSESKLMALGTF